MKKRKDHNNLRDLILRARAKGIQVRLERLEAGGIRLRDGICLLKGEKSLFLDKRRPSKELMILLREYLKD
ncbi:MAG: hypothetical protein ACK4WB_05370 [Desulfatiglandales bacterium]